MFLQIFRTSKFHRYRVKMICRIKKELGHIFNSVVKESLFHDTVKCVVQSSVPGMSIQLKREYLIEHIGRWAKKLWN